MARFIPESEIQEVAQDVLRSFEGKHGSILHYVPIDDVIGQQLGIHLEVFDDTLLPPAFHGDVLGYIDLRTNTIGVHESILPEESGSEGRYSFTMGHEAGHFLLHREEMLADPRQFSCFEDEQPCLLAKRDSDLSMREGQADCCSAHLIMPDVLIHQHWKALTGGHRPLSLRTIASRFQLAAQCKHLPETLAEIYIKRMARTLKVSPKALLIRLRGMGLIVEGVQLKMPV
jgi:hypothetical protein